MKLHLQTGDSATHLIRAYRPGSVVINDITYTASLIVTPQQLIADWPARSFAALARDHVAILASLEPEVVLLGTGSRLRFPPAERLEPLVAANIGFEIMDTAAACRTYNVLMGEGRRVVAGLIIGQE